MKIGQGIEQQFEQGVKRGVAAHLQLDEPVSVGADALNKIDRASLVGAWTISRADLIFRRCKRRILPIMSMVITPLPLLH